MTAFAGVTGTCQRVFTRGEWADTGDVDGRECHGDPGNHASVA